MVKKVVKDDPKEKVKSNMHKPSVMITLGTNIFRNVLFILLVAYLNPRIDTCQLS